MGSAVGSLFVESPLLFFREIMEAMWKPRNYKYSYAAAVAYTYLLTVPDSVSVYWAYGDEMLTHSNAFAVLPPSPYKNVAIVAMILHQVKYGFFHGPLLSWLQASRQFMTENNVDYS